MPVLVRYPAHKSAIGPVASLASGRRAASAIGTARYPPVKNSTSGRNGCKIRRASGKPCAQFAPGCAGKARNPRHAHLLQGLFKRNTFSFHQVNFHTSSPPIHRRSSNVSESISPIQLPASQLCGLISGSTLVERTERDTRRRLSLPRISTTALNDLSSSCFSSPTAVEYW